MTYDHDLIIDRGKIRKRNKGTSRQFRGAYGHPPLSTAADIPWRGRGEFCCHCDRAGYGRDGRCCTSECGFDPVAGGLVVGW